MSSALPWKHGQKIEFPGVEAISNESKRTKPESIPKSKTSAVALDVPFHICVTFQDEHWRD